MKALAGLLLALLAGPAFGQTLTSNGGGGGGYVNAVTNCGVAADFQQTNDASTTGGSQFVYSASGPFSDGLTGKIVRINRAGTSNLTYTGSVGGVYEQATGLSIGTPGTGYTIGDTLTPADPTPFQSGGSAGVILPTATVLTLDGNGGVASVTFTAVGNGGRTSGFTQSQIATTGGTGNGAIVAWTGFQYRWLKTLTNVPIGVSLTHMGWGTDNQAKLLSCFNTYGAFKIVFPAVSGTKCYYAGSNLIIVGDVQVEAYGARFCFPGNSAGFIHRPTQSAMQSVSAVTEGWSLTNAPGIVPSAGGTNCAVGDILEVSQKTTFPKNFRTAPRLKVASIAGSAAATLDVLDAGSVFVASPGTSPTLTVVSAGAGCTGVTVNTLTWSTPPAIGQANVSALTVGGTNGLNAASTCNILDDGTNVCIGDVVKLVGNRHYPWNYSNGQDTVSTVAARIATGGSAYTAGDVLTASIFSGSVAVGQASVLPNQNGYAAVAPQITVGTVDSTGAILTASISLAGDIKYTSFDPIAFTGGTGTLATFYLDFDTTKAGGYAESAVISKLPDANTIYMDRVFLTPFGATTGLGSDPVFRVMPPTKFEWYGGRFACADDIHDTNVRGRVPAMISVQGTKAPVLRDVIFESPCERGLEAVSTWMGKFDISCLDADDLPSTVSDFGYCGYSGASATGNVFDIQGQGNRHLLSTGAYQQGYAGRAGSWHFIGPDYRTHLRSGTATNAHGGAASDHHEDSYFEVDENLVVVGNTPSAPGIAAAGAPSNSVGPLTRGYMGSYRNIDVRGSTSCMNVVSEIYPFSGLFGMPNVMSITGLKCEGMKTVSNGASTIGMHVWGPSTQSTNNWGGTDWQAKVLITNASITDCATGTALKADEGTYGVVIGPGFFSNCDQLAAVVGPVDLAILGGTWWQPGISHTPTQGFVVNRSIGTSCTGAPCLTGTADVILANLLVNKLGNTNSNPSTLFRTQETTSTNGTNLWVGAGLQTPSKAFSLYSTSGGEVIVGDMSLRQPFGPGTTVLAQGTAVNVNATGDQRSNSNTGCVSVPSNVKRWRVTSIEYQNASVSLTAALAGIWTGASKTGTNLTANAALSAMTTSAKVFNPTLTAAAADVLTATTICLNVGTGQGSAATMDFKVFGVDETVN